MPMTKEWSIRDEVTGEWWSGDYRWVTCGAKRYAAYGVAATQCPGLDGTSPSYYRATARIVEAPLREMTDEECVAWVAWVNDAPADVIKDILSITVVGDQWQVRSDIASPRVVGEGATLFDAIRAAAKKVGA
jgi:hypothetical protein